MKTVTELQKERTSVLCQYQESEDKRECNRLKKRADFLKICIMYLETNPTIEFLTAEQNKLTNRINIIEKEAPVIDKTNDGTEAYTKNERAKYMKTMNISDTRTKLSTINFLLS